MIFFSIAFRKKSFSIIATVTMNCSPDSIDHFRTEALVENNAGRAVHKLDGTLVDKLRLLRSLVYFPRQITSKGNTRKNLERLDNH